MYFVRKKVGVVLFPPTNLNFRNARFAPTITPPRASALRKDDAIIPSLHPCFQVLVPQNGEKPALLESGNVFTLVMDTPYTQLVTVSAVVRGRRVSSSVVFSTVLSQAAILSMRAPLPVDAVWGISSDPASRLHQPRRDPKMSITEAGSSRFDGSTRGQRLERGAGAQHQNGEGGVDEPPSPLSLVYVGSLSLDGQKHIWLQQMEGLPRHRFAPTFLTFQDAGGEEGARVDDGEAATWKRQAADNFERRVRRAGVPLMKVASPRLVASDFDDLVQGGTLTNESAVAAPVTPLKEAVFKLLLDSVDRAGGEPHLMNPPWAREVFSRIAEGVKNASPDVLVVASGRTLGDVVLTRAARWAMGNRGRIVVDFPNMEPVLGISADVLATPSHFVARHPDIQALAAAAGAQVVVIPPGVDVTPSPPRQPEDNHQAAASEKPAERTLCHPWCMSDALENSNHCDPLCFVRYRDCLRVTVFRQIYLFYILLRSMEFLSRAMGRDVGRPFFLAQCALIYESAANFGCVTRTSQRAHYLYCTPTP